MYIIYRALLRPHQRRYKKFLKVKRLLFLPFKNLLHIENNKKYSKGPNSPSPKEDVLNLNRILIYVFYGIIFTVVKGLFESPIYCDSGDDNNSTTTANNQSKHTVGNESTIQETPASRSVPNTNITNNTQTESLNSRLGIDITAITTEVGKAVATATNKATEKIGEDITTAVVSAVYIDI
jgi:hypothetical protein